MDKFIRLNWKIKTAFCVILINLLAILFWWIARDQMETRSFTVDSVSPSAAITIKQGDNLEQPLKMPDGFVSALSIQCSDIRGKVSLRVLQEGEVLGQAQWMEELNGSGYVRFSFEKPIQTRAGSEAVVQLSSEGECTFYYGSGMSTGRYEIALPDILAFSVNGLPFEGMLVLSLDANKPLIYGKLYWPFVGMILVVFLGCVFRMQYKRNRGQNTTLNTTLELYYRYKFLIDQLVARDFKTKYKRSVLGILWSFLNPLLTMAVQYIIFSTLFRSNIPHFAVYLLSGTVLFNFFIEAVGQGLMGIVSNSALITKVYLPKYIYPISKVLSSAVNLLISFIPLILVSLFMGLPITKAYLLLPIGIIFLVMFCMGMALILSASMTFFRDTQFLWSVISTLWSYLTPLFYPESIIPDRFIGLYHCNPMYQFITFTRTIIIDGISPDPTAYIACLLWAVGMLVLGLFIFKKKQDRFVFYL